jgi:hypothetical protein
MVPVVFSPRIPVVSYTPGEMILKIPGRQQQSERMAAMTMARIMGRELFFAGAGVGSMFLSLSMVLSFSGNQVSSLFMWIIGIIHAFQFPNATRTLGRRCGRRTI